MSFHQSCFEQSKKAKCVKCKKLSPVTETEKRLTKHAKEMGFEIVHYCRPCAKKYITPPSERK